jgi:hypothetical protein
MCKFATGFITDGGKGAVARVGEPYRQTFAAAAFSSIIASAN